MILAHSRTQPWSRGAQALAVLLLVGQAACLSHEYRVPHEELVRLTNDPPERRAQRVRVVQEIGIRRAPALDPSQLPPSQPQAGGPIYNDRGVVQDESHVHVFVGGVWHGGGGGRYRGGPGPSRGPAPMAVAGPVGPQGQVAAPAGSPTVAPPAAAPPASAAPSAPAKPSVK